MFRVFVRALRRSRQEAPYVVLMLAVGIGTLGGAYCVLQAVLFTPPPYAHFEQLAVISRSGPGGGRQPIRESEVRRIRTDLEVFESLAIYQPVMRQLGAGASAARTQGVIASANLLAMLGGQPVAGRSFDTSDAVPGARPTIVVTVALARDLGVDVGDALDVDGITHEVIGVTADRFAFPTLGTRFYLPWIERQVAGERPTGRGIATPTIGRLRRGVSPAHAAAEIATVLTEADQAPAVVRSYHDELIEPVRGTLVSIQAAAGFVLLLTLINVSWLFYAGAHRQAEQFVTMAMLGATRARALVYYFGGVTAIGGIAAPGAAVLAWWLTDALVRVDNGQLSMWWHPALQVSILAKIVGGTVLAALAAAVPGAVLIGHTVRGGSRGFPARTASRRAVWRYLLMSAQATMVFAICGQAVRLTAGVMTLLERNIGIRNTDLVAVRISSQTARAVAAAAAWERPLRILDDVKRGGVDAAIATTFPLAPEYVRLDTALFPLMRGQRNSVMVDVRAVTASYFPLADLHVIAGSPLREGDVGVVINQALAALLFGGRSAIGEKIILGHGSAAVVGVVDTKARALVGMPGPELYLDYHALPRLPLFQYGVLLAQSYIVADARHDLAQTVAGVKAAARTHWPDGVVEAMLLRDLARGALGPKTFLADGLAFMAVLSALLMAGGTYGMVRQMLNRGSRDTAVKVALGASPRRLLQDMLRPLIAVLACGFVVGGLSLWAAGNVMSSVSTAMTEAQAPFLTGFVTAGLILTLATIGPLCRTLHRASTTDPLLALRSVDDGR